MIPLFRIDKIQHLMSERKNRLNIDRLRSIARSLSSNVVKMGNERTVNKEFVIQLWVKKYKHKLYYMDENGINREGILQDSNLDETFLDSLGFDELRKVFGLKEPRLYENESHWNDGSYSEWEWVEERSVIPSEWEDIKGIRLWLGQDMIEVPMSESDTSIWGLRSIIPGYIDGSSDDSSLFVGNDFVEIDGRPYEAKYHIWEIE